TNETDLGVTVIRATYDDLLALFYRPLSPRDLLQAGWKALEKPPVKGLPAPSKLGDLPDDQQAAMTAFEARFRPYASSVRTRHGPLLAAYVVADGMAESLHEQHT